MTAEDSFPLAQAELIALFLESLLFGAFAVLYFISIWILMYREGHHGQKKLHKWMLAATATTMFVLAMTHLCFDVQRAITGFVTHSGTPNGTLDFYSRLSNPTHVGKSTIYITQTLVGDSFVTYRMYVVWNRMLFIVVLPILLLIATAVAGYGICYELTHVTGTGAIFESNLVTWISSFFSLSLTTNVLATILIMGRIMWSNQRVRKYRAGNASALTHWGVVETIVHSAAIYSAALILVLATYLAGSNVEYVCRDSLQPLIGIVFTLIIIRVGLNESESSRGAPVGADSRISAAPLHHPAQSQQYPMRPLARNVSMSKTRDYSSLEGLDDGSPGAIHVEKDTDLESGDRSATLVPNRLHSVLSFVHPQRSHQPTKIAHRELGSPFSPLHDTHVQTGHGLAPCEPVIDSRSTPSGERDNWDDDDDLVGCAPTPIGVTEGTTTPEKTCRPSSFIPSTPVSASHHSDGTSVETSSTLPPSYRTRRSIPDLISAPQHPLPLPNHNNYPRAPPSAYPGALEFYPRPNTVAESRDSTIDGRRVLPNVPDHECDSDDEHRGESRNVRQALEGRKRSTDGGIRLDGGPVGYVPTLRSPTVDVEDEFQAGSTRPPSYHQTS